MTKLFTSTKFARRIAVSLTTVFLFEILSPSLSWALTGGPSQPEVQSFEPIGTTQMVDLSTGDFNYNIPLIDVGGYPINMSYHAGIGMDQEASTVGLGWNINPGVVNRSVRGLPDDFNGVSIINETNIRPNNTIGLTAGVSGEVFSIGSIGANTGVFVNNYKGVGFTYGLNAGIAFGLSDNTSLTGGLALSGNSQDGVDLSANMGLSLSDNVGHHKNKDSDIGSSLSVGSQYN